MRLKSINYVNFRNLDDSSISFLPGISLFKGRNGQGKTSVLESIHFAITGKSFRTSKVQEMVKYNKEKCGVFVEYEDYIGDKTISIKFNEKKKEFSYNGKKIPYDEYYGKLNVVSFIPEDIKLITGSPSVRRSFFDEEISQSDSEYFSLIKDYAKILKIRNHYLKTREYKGDIFQVYEEKFISLSTDIIWRRIEYIKKISIILNLNYRKLFDNKKELGLQYISQIIYDKKETRETIEIKLKEELERVKKEELRYGYTLVGPQKDEFKFILSGKDAKSYSSQGEKKSIIFSLKLSEIDMIFREKKENPIFLIDDISSYFDEIRKESILNFLQNKKIQLFISSTEELGVKSTEFIIENGVVNDSDKNN